MTAPAKRLRVVRALRADAVKPSLPTALAPFPTRCPDGYDLGNRCTRRVNHTGGCLHERMWSHVQWIEAAVAKGDADRAKLPICSCGVRVGGMIRQHDEPHDITVHFDDRGPTTGVQESFADWAPGELTEAFGK